MQTHVIPVIHYADDEQALRNAEIAHQAGSRGVMLIDMQGRNRLLLQPVARRIKDHWPDMLVGINFLGAEPASAIAANIAHGLDMTWTDAQPTHTDAPRREGDLLRDMLTSRPGHLLFAGVAFKHQRHEPRPEAAALRTVQLGFIPTTSGPATGVQAEIEDVRRMRDAIGPSAPLAIASGITPENVARFAPLLSHILIATGVSSSFHEFDIRKLSEVVASCR